MKSAVIDASVAVKWVTGEEHDDRAISLLTSLSALYAPAHWLAEASTAVWAKAHVHRLYGAEGIKTRLETLLRVSMTVVPLPDLVVPAGAISHDLGITPYDALYLALAEKLKIPLITADRRLIAKAATDFRFADLPIWIGDVVIS